MASDLSLLTLKTGQPESDVDTFVDPSATDDAHLAALNSLLITLHRYNRGNSASKKSEDAEIGNRSLEGVISGPLGPYLTSSDPKQRYLFQYLVLNCHDRQTSFHENNTLE